MNQYYYSMWLRSQLINQEVLQLLWHGIRCSSWMSVFRMSEHVKNFCSANKSAWSSNNWAIVHNSNEYSEDVENTRPFIYCLVTLMHLVTQNLNIVASIWWTMKQVLFPNSFLFQLILLLLTLENINFQRELFREIQ